MSKRSKRRNRSASLGRSDAAPPVRPPSANPEGRLDWYRRLDVSQKAVSLAVGVSALAAILVGTLLAFSQAVSDGDESSNAAVDMLVQKARAVESLRPSMTLGQFEERLGEPTLQNQLESEVREYVFVDPFYYVQAIVDSDSVIFFAVTTCSESFSPSFSYDTGPGQPPLAVKLGQTTFHQAQSGYDDAALRLGTQARATYRELLYFGNPGNYLTFVLAWNQAGLGGDSQGLFAQDLVGIDEVYGVEELFRPQDVLARTPIAPSAEKLLAANSVIATLRSSVVINTFGVGGPFLDFAKLRGATIGPDYVQVRVLD